MTKPVLFSLVVVVVDEPLRSFSKNLRSVLVCLHFCVNDHQFLTKRNRWSLTSLYQAFPPSEARRIWEGIELHHTPKHGSWLDMAEIELSVFTSQCLNRNIDTMEKLQKEASAWYVDRNKRQKGIDWQFSLGDAELNSSVCIQLWN